MGKSPKPLVILALGGVEDWPEWEPLRAQGHQVIVAYDVERLAHYKLSDLDLIVGPMCWHLTDKHKKYLPDAIKAARAQKYPKEDKV
jgi:hypothetical protein